MTDNTKIKSISLDNENVMTITLKIPAEELLYGAAGRGQLLNWDERSEVTRQITTLIADRIFQSIGKNIEKTVLKEVNWSEVVRSEVAQKVIREIAKNSY